MRCYQCGAELAVTQRRCPNCGAVQPAAAVPPGVIRRPQTHLSANSVTRTAAKTKPKTCLMILAGLAVILCLAVVIVAGVVQFGHLPVNISLDSYRETIGSAGGILEGPDGMSIVFPPNAFDQDVKISVSEVRNPPDPPEGLQSVSLAYEVKIPNDVSITAPVEVIIPLLRQEGDNEYMYMAYQWDGVQWYALSGYVEGNELHTQVMDFSFLEVQACKYENYGVVEMIHPVSDPMTSVHTWIYSLVGEEYCPGAASPRWSWNSWETPFGNAPCDFYPCQFARFNLPWGTYSTWCIEWTPGDTNGDNWKEWYHFFLTAPITIDGNSCLLPQSVSHKCTPIRIDYTLPPWQSALPGFCGMNLANPIGGQSITTGNLSATLTAISTLSQPLATVATSAGISSQIAASSTPAQTVSPGVLQPTPTQTATVQPSPQLSPTLTHKFEDFIVESRHIDQITDTYMGLAHLDDYVTLRGPITIEVIVSHRPGWEGPITYDDPYQVTLAEGETMQFYLDEASSSHPGDWNFHITLISVNE